MRNAEWQLSYPGTTYTFGPGDLPAFNVTAPDIGDYALRVSDGENPRGDGVSFGTDFLGNRTITFDIGVRGITEAETRANTAALARAWRADVVRSTPGAVAELRSQYRGSERVAFGRPRRFAPVLAAAGTQRFVPVVADFATADDQFYSSVETIQKVTLMPALGGGVTTPIITPVSTSRSSDRSTGITIGGELPTWVGVEITGPITNPVVDFVGDGEGFRYAFNGSLALDETLRIDPRPWRRTITVNGASAAGRMSRSSVRLSNAVLRPGGYEVSFSGTSESGTAELRVRFRDAYPTP